MAQDFLNECLSDINSQAKQNVPIDIMQSEFCVVCLNKDCSRAGVAKKGFVARVQNWQDSLFLNPNRADSDDPHVKRTQTAWGNIEPEAASKPHFVPLNYKSSESLKPTDSLATPEVYESKTTPVVDVVPAPNQIITPVRKPVNPFAPGFVEDKKESEPIIESGGSFTFG